MFCPEAIVNSLIIVWAVLLDLIFRKLIKYFPGCIFKLSIVISLSKSYNQIFSPSFFKKRAAGPIDLFNSMVP